MRYLRGVHEPYLLLPTGHLAQILRVDLATRGHLQPSSSFRRRDAAFMACGAAQWCGTAWGRAIPGEARHRIP